METKEKYIVSWVGYSGIGYNEYHDSESFNTLEEARNFALNNVGYPSIIEREVTTTQIMGENLVKTYHVEDCEP